LLAADGDRVIEGVDPPTQEEFDAYPVRRAIIMPSATALIAVLDEWVRQGIKEDPAKSNRTPIGVEYGWNGVAWCAETMSVAQARVGMHAFHEASVDRVIKLAKAGTNDMVWVNAEAVIQVGDMVCYDFGPAFGKPKGNPDYFHIAAVRDPGTQTKVQTDAGNESDAMRQQWRDRTYVQGFARLPWAATVPDLKPEQEDDLMVIISTQDQAAQYVIVSGLVLLIPDVPSLRAWEDAGAKHVKVPKTQYDKVAARAT
jgi:hypothetical protein